MTCNLDKLNEKIWPIFRARIEALQEVNSHNFEKNQYPDDFKPATENTDGPLDTLVKTTLIVQELIEQGVQFDEEWMQKDIWVVPSYNKDLLTELKAKYQLIQNNNDEYFNSKWTYGYSEALIDDLLTSYYRDVKQGIIDKNGNILKPSELQTSAVFNTVQNSRTNGEAARAHHTIARYETNACKTHE